MKIIRQFFSLSFLFFLTHCQSPSDQIREAFETVDKSLEKSNTVLSNSVDGIYSTINSIRQKNEHLALKADTIYFLTKQANNFIDSLKETIQLQDNLGTNLGVATRPLVFTPTGDKLRKVLLNVSANSKTYSIDSTKQNGFNSALESFRKIQHNNKWTKFYFEKTPTIVALTILSKLKNDCTNVATFILTDIKERLTD